MLRKSVHRDYYSSQQGTSAPLRDDTQGHLTHCIEMLRQTLMCHGDMSLVTYNWVQGRAVPFANFNGVHQCRNWDELVEWNEDNDVLSRDKEWSLMGRNGLQEGLERPP